MSPSIELVWFATNMGINSWVEPLWDEYSDAYDEEQRACMPIV